MWGSPSQEGSSLNLIMTGENFLFFSRQWEECLVFTTFLQEMSWSANRRLRDNSGLGWTKGQNIKWGNWDVNIIPLALIGSPGGSGHGVRAETQTGVSLRQQDWVSSDGKRGKTATVFSLLKCIYIVDLSRVNVAQLCKFWCWGLMG